MLQFFFKFRAFSWFHLRSLIDPLDVSIGINLSKLLGNYACVSKKGLQGKKRRRYFRL